MPTVKHRPPFPNFSDRTDDSDNMEHGELKLRQRSRDLSKSCVIAVFLYGIVADIVEDLVPAFTASH
jgi:hypothetical protein